jgi:hypothetical protein
MSQAIDQIPNEIASPLPSIAPGPTRIVRSSLSAPWHGILLERHFTLPGERTAAAVERHVISMLTGSPARLEHRNLSGRFVEHLYRPGAITNGSELFVDGGSAQI